MPMTFRSEPLLLLVFLWGACVLAASCESETQDEALERAERQLAEKVVAKANRRPILVGDLQNTLRDLPPYVRQSISGTAALRSFRKGAISFELLLGEAEKAGLGSDPDVLVATQKKLADELWGEVDTEVLVSSITEEVMRDFFAKNRERYAVPAEVTVEVLRVQDHQQIQRLRTLVRLLDGAAMGSPAFIPMSQVFRQVAQTHTERSGRLYVGPFSSEDADVPLPRPVVKAALELTTPGQLSELILDVEGFYLLRLVTRKDTQPASFESVRERVRLDALFEARLAHRRALVQKLRGQTEIVLSPSFGQDSAPSSTAPDSQ